MKDRTAEEVRAAAIEASPELRALVEALEREGGRVVGDAEFREMMEANPPDEKMETAVETALLNVEAREQLGDLAWREGMGEVSGLGGSYELACRQMLRAGVRWLREHSDSDPLFKGMRGVFGILIEDNDDARAMMEVVVKSVPGGPTGAMVQATIGSALWISQNGWEAYCEVMSNPRGEGEEE